VVAVAVAVVAEAVAAAVVMGVDKAAAAVAVGGVDTGPKGLLEGADPGVFDLSLADVDLGDTVRVLGWYNGTDFVIYQIVILQD
jgi:hypothetical protein